MIMRNIESAHAYCTFKHFVVKVFLQSVNFSLGICLSAFLPTLADFALFRIILDIVHTHVFKSTIAITLV